MKREAVLCVLFLLAALALGCGKTKEDPGPEKNPITGGTGPIGQGGDAAAMAVRRGAEKRQAEGDLKNVGIFLQTYKTTNGELPPTVDAFLNDIARDAPKIVQAFKDGRYALNLPRGADSNTIVAYEAKADYHNTRVVLMGDGSVKTMPEADFQTALKTK